jgi:hypothetical protein
LVINILEEVLLDEKMGSANNGCWPSVSGVGRMWFGSI